MILRLAEHLEIPLGDRNTLLLMGGYAPRYSTRSLVDETMAPVMAGLRGLLDAHLPNPSMLLDHRWNVLDANAAVYGLLSGCHPKLLEPPVNVIRLVVHPEGFAPRIRNLPRWVAHLHSQVLHRAEATHDPELHELVEELRDSFDHHGQPDPDPNPVLPLELTTEAGLLRFFSISARIESATDVTLERLHLETFLPADDRTRSQLAMSTKRE